MKQTPQQYLPSHVAIPPQQGRKKARTLVVLSQPSPIRTPHARQPTSTLAVFRPPASCHTPVLARLWLWRARQDSALIPWILSILAGRGGVLLFAVWWI
jgi:hypothetical protein